MFKIGVLDGCDTSQIIKLLENPKNRLLQKIEKENQRNLQNKKHQRHTKANF